LLLLLLPLPALLLPLPALLLPLPALLLPLPALLLPLRRRRTWKRFQRGHRVHAAARIAAARMAAANSLPRAV
jgi:hypothetical protein